MSAVFCSAIAMVEAPILVSREGTPLSPFCHSRLFVTAVIYATSSLREKVAVDLVKFMQSQLASSVL